MSRRNTAVVLGILAAAALSGCTSHASGSPTVQSSAPPPTTTAAPTSGALPPRPRDIDISGLDACKALTIEQGKQLEYDTGWQRPPVPDTDYTTKTPDCTYNSSTRNVASSISFVTSEGASTWITDSSRDTGAPPEKITVSEFPALQITVPMSKKDHKNCQVVVDVHDGQYINVFTDQAVGGSESNSDPFCEEAKKVAGMVLENAENR